jgi:hypothetical protein
MISQVLSQLGIPAAAVLARIRAHGFSEGYLLIDIARDVVACRLAFPNKAEQLMKRNDRVDRGDSWLWWHLA